MVGGRPYVKIVLVVKFARRGRTSKVTGKVGLYVPDSAGNPVLQQEAVIFPANATGISLQITAGDLFGSALPQGLAANTALPLNIDMLRDEALLIPPYGNGPCDLDHMELQGCSKHCYLNNNGRSSSSSHNLSNLHGSICPSKRTHHR